MFSGYIKQNGRRYFVWVTRDSGLPIFGCIAYGLIDRGTNLIQIRPTTLCALSCIFCSTDAGPFSKHRQTEYIVELDYLVEEFINLVKFKGPHRIEAHIDTVGDPLTYPKIVDLVQELASVPGVDVISMQTHGVLLSEKLIEELDEAGLSRINLSIDSMDPEKAKFLAGTDFYNLDHVLNMAEYVVKNTKIDLLIAPILIPGINDKDIPKIIEFAIKIGAGKYWPPLGIQKFEAHKRGRKPKDVKRMSWRRFYSILKMWEDKYKIKLILNPEDFGIHKRRTYPSPFKKGDIVEVKILAPGWLKGEALGIAKGFAITIVGMRDIPIHQKIFVKIIRTKHNIFLAKPI